MVGGVMKFILVAVLFLWSLSIASGLYGLMPVDKERKEIEPLQEEITETPFSREEIIAGEEIESNIQQMREERRAIIEKAGEDPLLKKRRPFVTDRIPTKRSIMQKEPVPSRKGLLSERGFAIFFALSASLLTYLLYKLLSKRL